MKYSTVIAKHDWYPLGQNTAEQYQIDYGYDFPNL
jgi:hypothetical protein